MLPNPLLMSYHLNSFLNLLGKGHLRKCKKVSKKERYRYWLTPRSRAEPIVETMAVCLVVIADRYISSVKYSALTGGVGSPRQADISGPGVDISGPRAGHSASGNSIPETGGKSSACKGSPRGPSIRQQTL